MARDISKEQLYEAVKTLVECENQHIHLPQQKLFTLFSIGFQYMLYRSTKEPGHYIIRTEDSYLAEKLARKSKDFNTRKFMGRMIIPRRLKFNNSMFHLDYFQPTSWAKTCELPQNKIKAALIIKNTASGVPMSEDLGEEENELTPAQKLDALGLEKHFYIKTLADTLPRTITIAHNEEIDGLASVEFPFIQAEGESCVKGVRLAKDINLGDVDM